MFTIRLPLAALLAASTPAVQQNPQPAFNRTAWQEDFAQLEKALEQRYANLAWMASPASGIDVPALHRRAVAALAAAQSDAEARDAIMDFVKGFHDGHFSELATLAPSSGPAPAEPAAPVPNAGDPQTGCAALGYASTDSVAFSLPFETLPGSVLIADGLDQPFRTALVRLPGKGMVGVVRIKAFNPYSYPAACLSAWKALTAKGAEITRGSIRRGARTAWFDALAERLRTLREKGARAVIVDVGNNHGGNDSGDWLTRFFTDRPVRSSRLMVNGWQDGAGYLDEQIDALAELTGDEVTAEVKAERSDFAQAKAKAATLGCDLSWAWHEQRPWRPDACVGLVAAGYASGPVQAAPASGDHDTIETLYWPMVVQDYRGAWTGPVYVLTDGKTYSAAEMFAAEMQDNHIARLAGTRTGGDGCGFMHDPTPLTLAHSRLRFRIPNCVRLRADGSDEVAGIAPDLPLAPTEGESARTRAVRLLGLIDGELPR